MTHVILSECDSPAGRASDVWPHCKRKSGFSGMDADHALYIRSLLSYTVFFSSPILSPHFFECKRRLFYEQGHGAEFVDWFKVCGGGNSKPRSDGLWVKDFNSTALGFLVTWAHTHLNFLIIIKKIIYMVPFQNPRLLKMQWSEFEEEVKVSGCWKKYNLEQLILIKINACAKLNWFPYLICRKSILAFYISETSMQDL